MLVRPVSEASNTFERVVVAYDGFDSAEKVPARAIELARGSGRALHLVHVVPEVPENVWRWRSVSAGVLHAALLKERTEDLERLVRTCARAGVEARAQVRTGVPHIELIRMATEVKADVIFVTGRSPSPGRHSVGSTTQRLLRKCPIPLWIERPARRTRRKRIMAAVDLGPPGSAAVSPNPRIMNIAVAVALRLDAEMFVFHAWSLWGENLLRRPGRVPSGELAQLAEQTRAVQGNLLQDLAREFSTPGLQISPILARGDPQDTIPAAVAENRVDLLVMGSISRTGLPGLIIGTTVEKIVDSVTCSVLTVKPAAFVSPVLG